VSTASAAGITHSAAAISILDEDDIDVARLRGIHSRDGFFISPAGLGGGASLPGITGGGASCRGRERAVGIAKDSA